MQQVACGRRKEQKPLSSFTFFTSLVVLVLVLHLPVTYSSALTPSKGSTTLTTALRPAVAPPAEEVAFLFLESKMNNPQQKRVKLQGEQQQGSGGDVDRLSSLPDDLILHILWLLNDTKSAVRTSALSKRWEDRWFSLAHLNFHSWYRTEDTPSFISFILAALKQRLLRIRNSPVTKLRVCGSFLLERADDGMLIIEHILRYAASLGVQHLVLQFVSISVPCVFPENYNLDSLKVLELGKFYAFPQRFMSKLTVLNLQDCTFCATVFSRCPSLTTLCINGGHPMAGEHAFSIQAPNLKTLTIKNLDTSTLAPIVALHTPKLVSFSYHDVGKVIDFPVITLPSLERAEVRLRLSKPEIEFYYPSFCKLSRGISNADVCDLVVPEEYIAVHAGVRPKAKLGH
ncbi:hypothetical protein Tsubulata_044924 [Turnera subulata]|uniref:F-box domain-containing protein n=1 Tax=Turnera subulata TaxID=218843 RepID=A0A9Q0FXY5_9ROSI|nr:hypothetical protein Tsubulata_044924 [Turnera subulata]